MMDTCDFNRSLLEAREWFENRPGHRTTLSLHETGKYRQSVKDHILWYYKYFEDPSLILCDWTETGPSEKTALVEKGARDHSDNRSLPWAARNMGRLSRQYPEGSWLFVKNREVLLAGTDLAELVREADEQGIRDPLIIRIERASPARRTAFHTWSPSRLT